MSLITDACLYVSHATPGTKDRLTEPLPFDNWRHQAFRRVPWETSGGTKGMAADVYVAGFNFVVPEDLVAHLADVLGDTSDAVLVVQMEGDPPEVHMFGEARAPH